jgi:flavodoxin
LAFDLSFSLENRTLKTLVTYFSITGNTKKVAEAIYETLEGDREIKTIDECSELNDYNLVFIGFPVHSHSVPNKVEPFLKNIAQGKKIALFSTHGSLTGSQLSREALEYAVVLTSKAKVLGSFSCRGEVSPEALELLMKSPEHIAWAEMSPSARNHPDQNDLEDAQAFARWVVTLYSQPKPF